MPPLVKISWSAFAVTLVQLGWLCEVFGTAGHSSALLCGRSAWQVTFVFSSSGDSVGTGASSFTFPSTFTALTGCQTAGDELLLPPCQEGTGRVNGESPKGLLLLVYNKIHHDWLLKYRYLFLLRFSPNSRVIRPDGLSVPIPGFAWPFILICLNTEILASVGTTWKKAKGGHWGEQPQPIRCISICISILDKVSKVHRQIVYIIQCI